MAGDEGTWPKWRNGIGVARPTEGGPVTWAGLQLLASIGKLSRVSYARQSWANWSPLATWTSTTSRSPRRPVIQSLRPGDRFVRRQTSDEPGLGLLSVIGGSRRSRRLPESALPPPLPPAAPPVPASGTERCARRVASARAADAKGGASAQPPVHRAAFPFREVVERRRPGTPLNGVAVAAVFASLAGLVVFALLPLGAWRPRWAAGA